MSNIQSEEVRRKPDRILSAKARDRGICAQRSALSVHSVALSWIVSSVISPTLILDECRVEMTLLASESTTSATHLAAIHHAHPA